MSFTINNPNATVALTGVAFTDLLPAGLVLSTPNGVTGSCGGGTITAAPGSGSVSLALIAYIGATSVKLIQTKLPDGGIVLAGAGAREAPNQRRRSGL